MKTVLIYGDSNSHGTKPMLVAGESRRYAPGTPWPDVMAEALGPKVRVITEGLPGRTTVHDDPVEGGVRNGLAVLPAILHSHKPVDLMIIMLGTNDLKPRFTVSAYEIARSLERMIRAARAEGVHSADLLIAPPPVRETGVLTDVFAGAEARQTGMAGQIEAAAARIGCGFVNAGDHVTVSDTDGVHWEAEAHQSFGAAMARVVAGQLARIDG
ncbi:SGNH/GDSL hydrolase family protein [Aestuariicoccus sp. MJ-SS9]|uniref:SGNH/GDSL hydrolase family protein n=1 Tax=Aestuariicoccus sp. MJ-SS9 TaxID=3079855 RepID=UPI0029091E92|nr:SGNH/GDSL hydrolase family protein [Aestuariicoccus sp. MJ-SS9]MDU8913106.1 SGNH/GDSL hydrolase family protein [Aestuariicoccus sp. MJ-SS9]